MTTTGLDARLERAAAGEPLSDEDRTAIFESRDVLGLGMAAETAKRRRHGAVVTFVRVAAIDLDSPGGDVEWPTGAGEVRLMGTLADPDTTATRIETIVARASGRVTVTGFSLDEVERAAEGSEHVAAEILRRLAGAGLAAIAAAPLDLLRAPEAMLSAARTARLPVLRVTVDRSLADSRFVELQRASELCRIGSFQAFAPLPRRLSTAAPSTGFEDVRQVALARLLVDVPHIQVDWPLYGPKLAQVGLTFGADDVDGVSPMDDTGEGRRRAPLEEIRRNIVAASGEPVERDGLFGPRR